MSVQHNAKAGLHKYSTKGTTGRKCKILRNNSESTANTAAAACLLASSATSPELAG